MKLFVQFFGGLISRSGTDSRPFWSGLKKRLASARGMISS